MPSGGSSGTTSERPKELMFTFILIVLNAFLGLGAAIYGLIEWGNELSALGLVFALIAFVIAKMLLDGNKDAWMWAVFLNVIAIALYAFSYFALPGIILSVLSLLYLNIPSVRDYFR